MKKKNKTKSGKSTRSSGKSTRSSGERPSAKRAVATKTVAKKPSAKASKPVTPARKSKPARSWLDDASQKPVIEAYARQLDSFIATMADGQVDASEIDAQEKRVVALMKQVEPKLDAELHEKVTQILCELTAYNIMQLLFTMHASRPKLVFRG